MESSTKQADTALDNVYQQLITSPHEFSFAQTIHILQSVSPKLISIGETSEPNLEAVSIKSRITYAMPNSEVYDIELPQSNKPIVWINFVSLAGIQGPLPMPYTEMVFDRTRVKDMSFRDFLDIFNHRLASLWYRLNKKYYFSFKVIEPEKSEVGKTMLSLSGLQSSSIPQRFEKLLFPFFNLLWQRSRSPYNLLILIQCLTSTQATIHSYQGKWQQVEKKDLSLLGKQFSNLGKDIILGKKTWDQMAGILIETEGLTWKKLLRFIPSLQEADNLYEKLKSLCQLYLGHNKTIKVKLNLLESELKGVKLSKDFKLGLNTWLKSSNTPMPVYSVLTIR